MAKPELIEQIKASHARFCDCTPRWVEGKHGQELKCDREEVLLWWPTPDLAALPEDKRLALHLSLPLQYNADTDTVDEYLLEGGYSTVTPDNFGTAYRYVTQQLEKALWQDNVGRQLLGRLASNDLRGDNT